MDIKDIVKKLEKLKNKQSELYERDVKNLNEITLSIKDKNLSDEEEDYYYDEWINLTSSEWEKWEFNMHDMNNMILKYRRSLKKYHKDLYEWFNWEIRKMEIADWDEERRITSGVRFG